MRTAMGAGMGMGIWGWGQGQADVGAVPGGAPGGVQRWRFCSQPPPLILSLPEGRWGSSSCSPPKDTAAGTPA